MRDLVLAIVGVIWVGILVLVGGRFFALLIGANPDTEIVSRIYRHSDFWVKPFFDVFGLTNEALESTGGVFEAASLLAFVVYFIAGGLILSGLRSAMYGDRWFGRPYYGP
jgi:hypothetical protein